MEIAARHSPRGVLSTDRSESLTAALTPSEKKEIEAGFGTFWKSVTGAEVKRSAKCYPELPFIYKTKHGILKGQIDLVFRDSKREWVILDYKTNRFSSAAEKDALVEGYRWQLGLYALAFWKLYGQIPARTLLYFSHSQEVTETRWSGKELERLENELETLYRAAVSA